MKKITAFICLSLILANQSAFAVGSSGFENASYSAKTLSQANATVARAQDPSTALSNPAGLLDLKGIQTSAGLQGLDWRIFHKNQVTGDHNQNAAKLVLIPSFGTSINPGKVLNDRLAFGVNLNSPFGLSTRFPSVGMGHYTGYKNSLKMVATTIAGAFKVTEQFRLGGGVINYKVYDYGQRFNYPNAAILGIPGVPDGMAYTETSGSGWGWNLGTIINPLPNHRIGASFRSKADIDVDGRVVVEDLVLGTAQGFPTAPHFQTGAHSNIPLPWNVTVGYAYEPSKKWAAEVDLGVTGWEVFTDQDFTFDQPNAVLTALGTIPRNYDNTISVHTGGHYQITDKVDLQGGFAFYQAAAPKKHVDNFLPDANRWFWSFGASYQWTPRFRVDFNYLFMLFATRHISNPGVLAKTGESIDGRYTSFIHGPMLNFTYQFDFPGDTSDLSQTKKQKGSKNPIIIPARQPENSSKSRAMDRAMGYTK
jgi:long-chain fatty acid transport protein